MIKTWKDRVRPNASLGEQHPAMQAEVDELRAELARLRALVSDAARYKKLRNWMSSNVPEGWEVVCQLGAVAAWQGWDDMDGYLDALHECEFGLCSKSDAAGAQGHTREQIGPDDRREGLTAHHVYCRAVTEDV